ncbi:HDOD domain-containing protein [Azonexus sp.]|uniref:HDOD domain-containing protein n=1 Tax=Azonexus sp. TaxID=1872668 RepID=UPI0035B19914
MPLRLSESDIVRRSALLPAFPTVVNDLLQTLDDDSATIGALIQLVGRDPVITARVLSIANAAAMGGRNQRDLRDMQVAVSLIGLAKLREIVLTVALAEFSRESRMGSHFWAHSVAVGVAAQELARIGHLSQDFSLVCGLLHDIGQLWMARCHPLEFQLLRMSLEQDDGLDIIDAERQVFGVDHCAIGRLLATAWHLPASVVAAIEHHHDIQPPADKLVAVTHVAEVVVNALDLGGQQNSRVSNLAASACELIGLNWNDDLGYLFGRIEARSHYLSRIFF